MKYIYMNPGENKITNVFQFKLTKDRYQNFHQVELSNNTASKTNAIIFLWIKPTFSMFLIKAY